MGGPSFLADLLREVRDRNNHFCFHFVRKLSSRQMDSFIFYEKLLWVFFIREVVYDAYAGGRNVALPFSTGLVIYDVSGRLNRT